MNTNINLENIERSIQTGSKDKNKTGTVASNRYKHKEIRLPNNVFMFTVKIQALKMAN